MLLTAECKEKTATDSAIEKMIIWYFISSDCINFFFLLIGQASRKIQQNKFNKLSLLVYCFCCFGHDLRPNAGHDLLIHEVSRSHTTTQHSR
jgi:hypothetical protein